MTDKFIDPKTGKELFRITDDNKELKIVKEKLNKDLSELTDEELIKEFEKRFKPKEDN